ncbi:MAG: RecQ family ATP-dependent DNA helicase [Prevotella sp.]|nr:RecQ family ATP-dependent DNA helicase [Prevotella sp.]
MRDNRIHDIGAIRSDGAIYHGHVKEDLMDFLRNVDFVCGHNIIHHDAKYLFTNGEYKATLVDTLYISPVLFPEHPYHRLLKDDKLISDLMNNPVNDCEKARDLLMDEIACWNALSDRKRRIFSCLLHGQKEFQGFLDIVGATTTVTNVSALIWNEYKGRICQYADVVSLIESSPVELAYALSLINTTDDRSITPGWVLHNYSGVEYVIGILRQRHCKEPDCEYCNRILDLHHNLKNFFGYDDFRTYEGEPLQENAARAAVEGKSLLAIFPTGGGKSLTFQLPALTAGRTVHGLTVVISPLQSLMKDQVDNLAERGITDAVTINGLLDPITRALAIQRVQDGEASLLYITPEMLRSKTIERILLARHVVRFVIDEAHCFSSWGQDFRVDYLYIGKFISEYQKKKGCKQVIPVSCFTATAKQKVVQDICDYFKQTLYLNLALYASKAVRTNLRYSVLHADTDEEKYQKLRALLSEFDCPAIVYVARTRRTLELSSRLTRDGYKALPFNGKMDTDEKVHNQDEFMSGRVRIIVATSAFGMGVDKKDVGLVVHYNISDSLENYVQEAGRAGRDPQLSARCFVLYSDSDLDKHFVLLNQTKLSISEIQQVWKAVKTMTKQRSVINSSSLEIARLAGWSDTGPDIETRVRTAISALEQAGYLERGNNVPHVYATGITVRNMDEARQRLMNSVLFDNDDREKAARIIKSLISQKYIAKAQDAEAESRIDYLADILGLKKGEVISAVVRMRQDGILADSKDITAYLQSGSNAERKMLTSFERFAKLEQYILKHIPDGGLVISCKQLNNDAVNEGIASSNEKSIRTLLYFLTVKNYIRKSEDPAKNMKIIRQSDMEKTINRSEKRWTICRFILEWLYGQMKGQPNGMSSDTQDLLIPFSIVELLKQFKSQGQSFFSTTSDVQIEDVEESLLFLSNIEVMKLDGGFMVLYSAMTIHRLKDMKLRYKQEDYRMLDEFYKQKIQQVHIVGEYANLMVRDYNAAQQYVRDYFQMDYKRFISKYFKGERLNEIQRNITPERYQKLFAQLSDRQKEIISDSGSKYIVVAAGPGSGKTRVLVHKLASLLLMEDVKHEQLLMLTFSRAAATEFKRRLYELIGEAANYVEIKTFHSYSFDLLGRIGNIEDAQNVVSRAAEMINQGEVEPTKIGKTVLVIDEAQDMSGDEYALVKALMTVNEEMRVIAVGDDDQNIFEFRGSDSKYMQKLTEEQSCSFFEMTENYRSSKHIVSFANSFVKMIGKRMKTSPIASMSHEDGSVMITRHWSKMMYQPLVEDLLSHRDGGTTCVLTQTNSEALILVALLRRHGINCKLIQSSDDFRFWNLAEVRYFLKYIDKRINTPIIPEELWEDAKQNTFSKYQGCDSLEFLKQCIKLFEQTNKTRYITDFREFVFESSLEDFCDISNAEVVVSTIHKAKGREFDDVYMLITDSSKKDDILFRKYYVGITRAKHRLFIHTNGDLFEGIGADYYTLNKKEYPMPNEVVLQLTFKDVFLDFFKWQKKDILSLRSGETLLYKDNMLYKDMETPVARLSQKMQSEITAWQDKGYIVNSATVSFIVAWKPKDAPREEAETAVLLADMVLTL